MNNKLPKSGVVQSQEGMKKRSRDERPCPILTIPWGEKQYDDPKHTVVRTLLQKVKETLSQEVARHAQSNHGASTIGDPRRKYPLLLIRDLVHESLELNPPPSNEDRTAVYLAWQRPRWTLGGDRQQAQSDLRSVMLRRAISIMSLTFEDSKFAESELNSAIVKFTKCYRWCFSQDSDRTHVRSHTIQKVPRLYRHGKEMIKGYDVTHGYFDHIHLPVSESLGTTQLDTLDTKDVEYLDHMTRCLAIVGAVLCSIATLGLDLLNHALNTGAINMSKEERAEGEVDIRTRYETPERWCKKLISAHIIMTPFSIYYSEEPGLFDETAMRTFLHGMVQPLDSEEETAKATNYAKLHAMFSAWCVYESSKLSSRWELKRSCDTFDIKDENLRDQVINYFGSFPPYGPDSEPFHSRVQNRNSGYYKSQAKSNAQMNTR